MKQQTFAATAQLRDIGWLCCLLLLVQLVAGCSRDPAAPTPGASVTSSSYFQTPFQSECQFIVRAIVMDIAEQMYYAANHRLPDEKSFTVNAREKRGTSQDAPIYELQITLPAKQVKCDVTIDGPIWSPQVYEGVAAQLSEALGLSSSHSETASGSGLLDQLKDGTPETIERENQRVSAALEGDFTNPELHEQAALLYGAFLLRDHSGKFLEIRSPLSRLTAHLAMARTLRGQKPAGVNGQMAEAMMLTVVGSQALALERLDRIGTNNAAVLPFARALRARNTGDHRPLDNLKGLAPIETVEWFYAWANSVAPSVAWEKLNDQQKLTIDFVRAANELGYSVEIGHELLATSIPLESREISSVYSLSQSKKLGQKDAVAALNEMPEGCFSRSGGQAQVRVIGWGQWANFLQRHLCHAIQQNFYFMNYSWGVHDDAKEFAAKCAETFGGLRLYPFVRRFNCTDVASYHKAVDDGFKVTVATPHLVPADCWNYLCYKPNFGPVYTPNPNPHVNEWHSHNPPPGTVYDLHPRLNHPSLVNRGDAVARFEQLHEMAPCDGRIIYYLLQHKYKNQPSYEQAAGLYQRVLPYNVTAMRDVSDTVRNEPERFEKLMLEAAALDPTCFYMLGDYKIERHEDDLAAKYIDQACAADPDRVSAANHAYWRVQYYLKKGQVAKAREIADEGGEVYSFVGLEAKASFLEQTTNYTGAFEWFAKLEERYDDSGPLIAFCERYKEATGDKRFESELNKRVKKLFPKGIEKVSLEDMHGPPTDGVSIKQQSRLLTSSGLRVGDVIVALNGTRTRTFAQYMYVRYLLTAPEMDLIVWQGSAYHVVRATPPDHRFGVDFGDYRPE